MNTAYRAYLETRLADYPGDQKAVTDFINWLDANPDKNEPDLWAYGDAKGTYAVCYVDHECLEEQLGYESACNNDLRAKVEDINEGDLLREWANRAYDLSDLDFGEAFKAAVDHLS